MTDIVPTPRISRLTTPDARTRLRKAAEFRFRLYGKIAIGIGVAALIILLSSVFANGVGAFRQTFLKLELSLDAAALDPSGARDVEAMKKVTTIGYGRLLAKQLKATVAEKGIGVDGLTDKDIADMISKAAPAQIRDRVLANPELIGQTVAFRVLANGRIDGYLKGRVTMESAVLDGNVSPAQLHLADTLRKEGVLVMAFNWGFITMADASELRPEAAGLGVAILGSAYMMIIVLVLALPIGVATSIYLEEFAPRSRWTDLIEVNISNLAAVPSIVFGILGLAIFINFAGLPQSAPIVGGLVLTLMTLPTIIIATRASLKAVPPSIRDAALGVGASKMQTIMHHVVPLAMPGILTGTIIGLAQALGETAPLLLIGMVAFVRDFPAPPPEGFFDPASALPVQVYNFTQRADPAFAERASGAIIVLMVFLLAMNLLAILLRRRFERRW
ncbi:MAG: phosphate ABC transporter permease PstA [Albidovulum sp.]